MSIDFSEFTLTECDETIAKYGLTDFDTYIVRDFPRYTESQRLAILQQWDAMLANETRLSKEHAGHFARKRQLDSVHFALKSAGR